MAGSGFKTNENTVVALSPASDGVGADPLSSLYLRYRQDVVDFVRRKFGPGPPEPEDVAQAVFLQVAAQGHPELIRNPRSFLIKSAQNVVLDYRRRSARRQAHVDEFSGDPPQVMSDFDAERVVTGEERLKMLAQALARLPRDKRQIVLLSRIHDWSCERIGSRFGMSADAVQKQIERVLKECLLQLDGAGTAPRRRSLLARLRSRT